jgi:hypothetical protein
VFAEVKYVALGFLEVLNVAVSPIVMPDHVQLSGEVTLDGVMAMSDR